MLKGSSKQKTVHVEGGDDQERLVLQTELP